MIQTMTTNKICSLVVKNQAWPSRIQTTSRREFLRRLRSVARPPRMLLLQNPISLAQHEPLGVMMNHHERLLLLHNPEAEQSVLTASYISGKMALASMMGTCIGLMILEMPKSSTL